MHFFGVSVVIPRLPCRDGSEKKKHLGGPQIWSYEKIFVTLSNARRQGEQSDTFSLYRPDLER